LLGDGGKSDFLFGKEFTFPPVRVDRILKDGDIVEQGGVRVVARHTPGHTKGSTTFLTTVDDGGRRYELAFVASVAINPGTSLVANPNYPGIVEDWETTYRLLRSLKPDVWVAGHAGAFDMPGKFARVGKGPNPYIDAAGYQRYVDLGEQQFRKTLAEQQSLRK
jgi:metallo-beta-lactamase class B